ncbi:hypothetical protein CJ030_MR5G013087 [Morella rubra]|uniref:NADH:ubiquinone oxidoreductase intermediate-associated protein 30 domain-containing protein n=1 Tax=Morella rubra TaxID=262757 RepID=A0A6A1VJY2_9ROSI|nr:hypothetical protein CJ030_MR5G013087 [Morella rubra]
MTATAAATTTTGASFGNSNTLHYHSNHKRHPSNFLGITSLSKSSSYYHITTGSSRGQNNLHSCQFLIPRATASETGKDNQNKNKKTRTKSNKVVSPSTKDDNINGNKTETMQEQQQEPSVSISLDDVNPVGLGRRSRQLFDEVWRKFSGLGQISRTTRADDKEALDALLIREGPMCEFAIPGAQNTTVLVVGATSRIGRIVVRKLMLRGYSVKDMTNPFSNLVLVERGNYPSFCSKTLSALGESPHGFLVLGLQPREGLFLFESQCLTMWHEPKLGMALVRKSDEEVVNMLPRSVEVVIGDVGDPVTLKAAVEGCSKIIYCATARSAITGDLFRVDHRGVYNLTKAFQDYNNKLAQLRAGKSSKSKLLLAKFKSANSLDGWDVRRGTYFQDVVASKYDGGMDAKFEYTETGEAVFSGYVFTRGGYVELSTKLSLPLGRTLDRYEGLVLSVGGNGRSYILILEAGPLADLSQSKLYFARFSTKLGFCRVRVPFSSFRPVKPDDPPLDPFLVHTLTIRFEPRRQRPVEGPTRTNQDLRSFQLILEYIKALPAGQETDFILVSCTGLGIEPTRREQVLKAKRAGEDSLRKSGLGYTIIRPGPLKSSYLLGMWKLQVEVDEYFEPVTTSRVWLLQEEPGGQRALIFDQGNRISQGISCADVADICVKALHDSTARNKSFDVCYEYVAEQGRELYELVAHLPDKANNYLAPALSVLEKNT